MCSARRYRIAGTTVAFSSEPGLAFPLPPGYAPFLVQTEPCAADATYTLTQAIPAEAQAPGQAMWQSAQWSLYRHPCGSWRFDTRANPAPMQTPAAWIQPDFAGGLLFPRRRGAEGYRTFPFGFPVDEQLLLNLFAARGIALLHGCSIAWEGQALLACGKSGAGKSTLCRLARDAGADILNDDRSLVWTDEGGQAWVSATPWHGEEADISPQPVPLTAICRLEHGESTTWEPLGVQAAFHLLLANAIAPFYLPQSLDPVTGALSTVAGSVSAGTLRVRPGSDTWNRIRGFLAG